MLIHTILWKQQKGSHNEADESLGLSAANMAVWLLQRTPKQNKMADDKLQSLHRCKRVIKQTAA